jgi:hypothetical protein
MFDSIIIIIAAGVNFEIQSILVGINIEQGFPIPYLELVAGFYLSIAKDRTEIK